MAIHIQMMVHDERRLYQTATMVVQRQLMCHRIANICHCHCALYFFFLLLLLLCRWVQVFFVSFFRILFNFFYSQWNWIVRSLFIVFFCSSFNHTYEKSKNWMFIYDFYTMWFLIFHSIFRFSVQQRVKYICFGSNFFPFASTIKINK